MPDTAGLNNSQPTGILLDDDLAKDKSQVRGWNKDKVINRSGEKKYSAPLIEA